MLVSMSPKVIVKTNILKLCEKLLKEVAKPPKIANLGSPCPASNADIVQTLRTNELKVWTVLSTDDIY